MESIAERNQVYWQEILYRAHFGACTALMRLHEWLHGSKRALADENVLMLAAGIRGFLEAAADTFQSFSDVPSSLADCHMVVHRAIKGEFFEQPALAPELESMLIHFAYARKLKQDEGPTLHNAKTAKDTISAFEEPAPAIGTVYAKLCDYAHPARSSVFRFAREITQPDSVTFDPEGWAGEDSRNSHALCEVGRVALMLGVGPVVMTLKGVKLIRICPCGYALGGWRLATLLGNLARTEKPPENPDGTAGRDGRRDRQGLGRYESAIPSRRKGKAPTPG